VLFLTIDQGTTSSRALLIDNDENTLGLGQQAIRQYYPENGWVEHDPEQIWLATIESCQQAMEQSAAKSDQITAVAITNQRETVVLWDKKNRRATL
jgi:glycerol kinase